MDKIKWLTLDSGDGERTLKQHGFILFPHIPRFSGEMFNGNRSLCGRIKVMDENEDFVEFSLLEEEPLNREKVCKKCLKHSGL